MASRRAQEANDIGAGQRLRQALTELKAVDGSPAPTAKALCKRANVSRNALYRYHADILLQLYRLQQRRAKAGSPSADEVQRLRAKNTELRGHVTAIAALVDHYFTAWSECQVLLVRRERELAETRRKLAAKPVSIR